MSQMIQIRGYSAADDLTGVVLPNGWTVGEKLKRGANDTGGNFSVNYWVTNDDGRRGFCKVLNIYWLSAQSVDPVTAMGEATRGFEFERDIARQCALLSKVITAIDDGTVHVKGYAFTQVSYIIFESAEQDIRRLLNHVGRLDTAVRLRCIHNLAVGIKQLHGVGVAHQDIKPSNALVFTPDLEGLRTTKIGDLGRASARDRFASHDNYLVAGDGTYAPPEGLYREVPASFDQRRLACDLYQLGSMVAFVFANTPFNGLLHGQLHPVHSWLNWNGSLADVMPYVRDAFGRALNDLATTVPVEIRGDIVALVRQLCEPDYRLRGHLKSRQTAAQYALDRVITELDRLSRRAQVAKLQ